MPTELHRIRLSTRRRDRPRARGSGPPRRSTVSPARALAATLSLACSVATQDATAEIELVAVPAAGRALAPQLAAHGGVVALSWLEPRPEAGARGGHRLRFATLETGAWSEPTTVVGGPGFFANWADLPSVVPSGGDAWLAHWLARSADETYAYDVRLARSTDAGRTWSELGALHDDGTETEHGFVSIVPHGDGFTAIWLDGRDTATGGPMALRAAQVGADVESSVVLDDDVCTCCQTDLAETAEGLVAVYRDHAAGEVRDVAVVRRTAAGWTEPRAVHDDGWVFPACPVNGPAVDAVGDQVVVGWYTAADGAQVKVAFSVDAGASFDRPFTIDRADPVGRVDVACVDGGAAVSWIARSGDGGALRVCFVSADTSCGEPVTLGPISPERDSGFPRLVRHREALVVVWRDTTDSPRLRSAIVPLSALPRPTAR